VLRTLLRISNGEVGWGALQIAGGAGEAMFGVSLAGAGIGGGPETGFLSLLAVPVGAYIGLDGVSNFVGGLSRAWNGFAGTNNDWNFMRKTYERLSPEYGINLYNGTQAVIAVATLRAGIQGLSKEAWSHEVAQSGAFKVLMGADTQVEITAKGKLIFIETRTKDGGHLVQTTQIDTSKVGTGTLLIMIDTYNIYNSTER
jgi:hypothetical protein